MTDATRPRLDDLRRRLGRQMSARQAARRFRQALPPTIQIVVACVVAYSIAHYVFGHAYPLVAVTVALSSLGFVRDARPIRVLETAVAMIVGIALAELLVMLFGRGVWQLAIVLFTTLILSRTISPHASFAIAAGVQASLVTVLPLSSDLAFERSIDGIIGGAVALVATALLPRDPRRAAAASGQTVIDEVLATLDLLATALQAADREAATVALGRIRASQPALDSWAGSLDSARAIAQISPFLHKHVASLEDQHVLLEGMELATRNLRVIARRVDALIADGVPRERIGLLFQELAEAVRTLMTSLERPAQRSLARQALTLVAIKLDPELLVPEAALTDQAVVLMLRPLVVDLLAASGVDKAEARATLPHL
jgi:uncharacterized membrane protein YgaE (UPF0421/DUF939 family)